MDKDKLERLERLEKQAEDIDKKLDKLIETVIKMYQINAELEKKDKQHYLRFY